MCQPSTACARHVAVLWATEHESMACERLVAALLSLFPSYACRPAYHIGMSR
jgi:hypothetical protein